MAGTNEEPEVKDVERIEVTPAGADAEDADDAEETDPESSQEETEGEEADESEESDEDADKPDELVTHPTETAPKEPPQGSDAGTGDELAEVENETPKERALRLELTRTRAKLRGERTSDLIGPTNRKAAPAELAPEEKAVIGKYKPEEIQALKEVFPVLAKELGFVRKDELETSTFMEKSQDVLDGFLEKHPEYLPENDTEGTLWNALKSEYTLYKPSDNPKDLLRILEKAHREVFGIKPSKGALPSVNAQREKVKNASHAGASSTPASPRAKPASAAASSARVDMLKGFTDKEKAEMLEESEDE